MEKFDVYVRCTSEGAFTVRAKDEARAKVLVEEAIDENGGADLPFQFTDQGEYELTGDVVKA